MIEAIIGILSMIVPLLLDHFCDKITDEPPKRKVYNEIKKLNTADSAELISVSWIRHDKRLRSLLRSSRKRKSAK